MKILKTQLNNLKVDSWLDYIKTGEKQNWTYGDSTACVSFALLNVLEILLNYYLKNNLISENIIKWLKNNEYIINEEFNFSDRALASMSKTTQEGNSASKVMETIAVQGIVPETKWTFDMETRIVQTLEDYMKHLPTEILNLAKLFLSFIKLTPYKINREMFDYYIGQTPIMTFVRSCKAQNGIYYPCDTDINHACVLIDRAGDYDILFDSYERDKTKKGIEKYLRYHTSDYNYYDYGFIFKIEFMEENFVKILKDENSSTVGFFIPAISEDALKTLSLAFGRDISKLETQEDWEKIIDGKFNLKYYE